MAIAFGRTATSSACGAHHLVAALVLLAGMGSSSGAMAQRASTIIVLDGSNSMNARLPNDKTFKHVTLIEGLRAALAKSGPNTELGLATFGARRASDCTDAEVSVPPSTDSGRVLAALEKFQPRGFSPVVLALRLAAKALPSAAEKVSLVLVLDDLASCRGEDPCKVAGELKQQNPALAIHVVGLGLKPADQQVLACMTRQTGGQLFNAVDGPGVAPAIEQALLLASLERPITAVAAVAKSATPLAPPQPAPALRRGPASAAMLDESRSGLHLSARLIEDALPLNVPVRWRVWREADAPGSSTAGGEVPAPAIETVAPVVSRVLADGRYVVEARAGLVTVRRPFEITSQGPTPVRIILNAGLVSIAVPLAMGMGPAPDTVVSISLAATGSGGRNEPLWGMRTAATDLVLPAGDYRISAQDGLATAERLVSLGAGATNAVELALGAGRLAIDESGAGGESPGRPQLSIEIDDAEAAGGRREVYRSTNTRLDTTLPAGSYLVTLRRGTVEHRERVAVRPGETASRTIALQIAKVRLVSRSGSAQTSSQIGQTIPIPVNYRVERLDGTAPILERWSETELALDLTPGRYRFEAKLGDQNAVAMREVDVRAGFETRVELNTGAGSVRLKLAGNAASLGLGTVYWQIFDERGAAIWRTGQSEPALALLAGRYRVRVETRDRVFERTVDVRAGDSGVIEVGE